MSSVRFLRAPSAEFLELFRQGAFLAPTLARRIVSGLPLIAHFREGDKVIFYCGKACLLKIGWSRDGVRFDAHPTYQRRSQPGNLFQSWKTTDCGLAAALDSYISTIDVEEFIGEEGRIQNAWSLLRQPWVPMDIEAVLGYANRSDQEKAREVKRVRDARIAVEELAMDDQLVARKRWAVIPDKGRSAELDLLAVDEVGHLVLAELKRGGNSSAYYAPLQLLQYVWEWHAAMPEIRAGVEALIRSREEVGLIAKGTPKLTGTLRPVIGFGEEPPSPEVCRRLDLVLGVVNTHLPAGVSAIEVWRLVKGVAKRM